MRALLIGLMLGKLIAASVGYSQWNRVSGVPPVDVGSFVIRSGTMYAGTDSAVYMSSDGGNIWTRSTTLPGDPSLIDALEVHNGVLYAGTGTKGIYRSTNNGASWEELNAGLVGLGSRSISALTIRGGTVYAGTHGAGVFRLQQNSWFQFGDLSGSTAGNVSYLASKGDTLIAGAGGNGYIWFAPAGATGWSGVLIAPLQGEPLIVTSLLRLGAELVAGTTYGVYRSSNEGASWTRSGMGGPGGGRHVKVVQSGNQLYAASTGGDTRMYQSPDGGFTWTRLETVPLAYTIESHGSGIYAGRIDGLWFRTTSPTSVDDLPALVHSITLEQNYPNPFNPSTHISYSLRAPGVVTVTIYDMLGREIATIVHGEHPAGSFTVPFDGTGLSSGVYFYRLTAEGKSMSRRMMLAK